MRGGMHHTAISNLMKGEVMEAVEGLGDKRWRITTSILVINQDAEA